MDGKMAVSVTFSWVIHGFPLSWFAANVSLERATGPGPQADLQGGTWKATSGELQVRKGEKKPTNQLLLHSWGHLQNIKLPGEQITAAGNSHCFENISQRINIQDRMAKFEMLLFYTHIRINIYSHYTFNFPCSSIYFPCKYSWVFGKKANGSVLIVSSQMRQIWLIWQHSDLICIFQTF